MKGLYFDIGRQTNDSKRYIGICRKEGLVLITLSDKINTAGQSCHHDEEEVHYFDRRNRDNRQRIAAGPDS